MKEKTRIMIVSFLDLLSSFNKVWIEIFGAAFTILAIIYIYILFYHKFSLPVFGFAILYTVITVFLLYIYFRDNKGGGFSHLFSCKK